jgi:hypothetical protein
MHGWLLLHTCQSEIKSNFNRNKMLQYRLKVQGLERHSACCWLPFAKEVPKYAKLNEVWNLPFAFHPNSVSSSVAALSLH